MAAFFLMSFDTGPIDRAMARLGARLPIANTRALNRTATTVKAFLSRDIAKDMGMKVGTVKALIGITKATADRQNVQLAVSGKRLPLIDFGARGPFPSRGRGRGVTAVIQGQRKSYPHAFIAQMPTGHKGVFERVPGKFMKRIGPRGGRRQAIRELRGVSLPHVFHKMTPGAMALGRTEYVKNLAHETQFLLRQLAS